MAGCSDIHDPRWRDVALSRCLGQRETMGAVFLAAWLLVPVQPARSQQATSLNGPPVQVEPTASEPGVPPIQYNLGTPNPFSGSAGPGYDGGTDPGAQPGGIGSGTAGAGAGGGFVAASWSQYQGQAVGTGQCVALVQAADPAVGLTRTWVQGGQVQGDTSLAPGTAIAIFDSSGRYANATDGSSHAAIYLGQNAQGVQVMEQWLNKPASYRTISWNNPNGTPANTGSAFHVITHG